MNSPLENNYYYHVYNRGVEKRTIFQESHDYYRFLETINFYRLHPTPRKLSTHLRFGSPPIPTHFTQNELVRIICFCLMPNHFHLLIQQIKDGGISEFIRRLSDSYTRFFNTKYGRVGALLQGKFKAKLVEKDEYLLQLSKYIHRNPLTLPTWKGKLTEYSFSSYPGYLSESRRYEFCDTKTIGDYFITSNKLLSYQSFVEESNEISLHEALFIENDYEIDTSDVVSE